MRIYEQSVYFTLLLNVIAPRLKRFQTEITLTFTLAKSHILLLSTYLFILLYDTENSKQRYYELRRT